MDDFDKIITFESYLPYLAPLRLKDTGMFK